jgi:two-component system sensor histidine kinase CreC
VKIGLRILLGYFLIVGLAAWFLLNVFVEEVKPGVRDTLEDTLVDTATVLSGIVANDMKAGTLSQAKLAELIKPHYGIIADINGVKKKSLDFQVLITDEHGLVLFDSDGLNVGKDYSQWNDINRTLHGEYGARSTRSDPDDPATSVMHVAAPIMDGSKMIGALSVAKPVSTVEPFIKRSQRKILQRGTVLLISSLLIGIAFAYWLNRELGKLESYTADVEAGKKTTLPPLGKNEIGQLGRALESMRNKLEGKEYVEELMHTLAHELKSPIAAIQGSAELLREDMPPADRQHFLANILEQNARQKHLIDKLLALVAVEKQQQLTTASSVEIPKLIDRVGADFSAKLAAKKLRLEIQANACTIQGDELLLRQAIGNLLDNAIEFSPAEHNIRVSSNIDGHSIAIMVIDSGTGIPDYAMPRLFERFYSLPRPNAGKSTGLGLPFVKEVALLHRGSIDIGNNADGGAYARMTLPLA